MNPIVIQNMNRIEAEACLLVIRAKLEGAQQSALDFDRRMGWAALEYPSLEACLEAKLTNYSAKHGYRLRAAAEVTENLRRLSPIGEMVVMRERWVRDSHIDDLAPDEQVEAHSIACAMAQAEGVRLAAGHFAQAVAQVRTKTSVFQSRYFVVSHMVSTGSITADLAQHMVEALDKLTPKQRGHILPLIAEHQLTCPLLFAPLASMYDRKPGRESYVLPEVMSGYLGGVPLARATEHDLARANAEAAAKHQAEAEERERLRKLAAGESLIEWKTLSIPVGDWHKCIALLERDLGTGGFEQLMKAGMAV